MSSHDQSWPPSGGQQGPGVPGGSPYPGTGPVPYGGQPQFPGTGQNPQFPGTGGIPQGGQPPYPGPGFAPQGYPEQGYPAQGYPAPQQQQPYPGQYPQQQPGYPPQFGGQPPSRGRKPWLWLVPVVVVVVAAAVVVPILLTRGGGSGTSSASAPPPKAMKPWTVNAGATGKYPQGFGAWINGADLITANSASVSAYQRSTGKRLWNATPPDPNALFCGSSRNVAQNRIAVGYGDAAGPSSPGDQVCTNLALIDLTTGKFVWTDSGYLKPAQYPPSAVAMYIAGGSVFTAFNPTNLVTQVDLTTGQTKSQDNVSDGNNASCTLNDVTATKTTVYYAATCNPEMATNGAFDAIRAEDVNTGQVTGFGEISMQSAKFPSNAVDGVSSGVGPPAFVSASPMVLVTTAFGQSGEINGAYVGVDSSLNATWAVEGDINDASNLDDRASGDNSAAFSGFGRAFVAGNVLYAETDYENPSGTQNNKVVAIDTKTGQQLWGTSVPGVAFVAPVAVQGSSVVAVGNTLNSDGSMVLSEFNVKTGAATSTRKVQVPIPGSNELLGDDIDPESVWYVAADNRIYGVTTQTSQATQNTDPQVFAFG